MAYGFTFVLIAEMKLIRDPQKMSNFFDKLGSNFFVAAFVPALGFLIVASFIFSPLIPVILNGPQNSTFDPINTNGLLVLTSAIVLGFILSSLTGFINRFFQGDYLFEYITLLKNYHWKKAKGLRKAIDSIKSELLELDKKIQRDRTLDSAQKDRLTELFFTKLGDYYDKIAIYKQIYPPLDAIRPTKFGNIFQAIDYYALEQYGLDREAIWPCLFHVIPNNFHNQLDQSWNSLSFILNCAVLAFLTSVLCFASASFQLFLKLKAQSNQVDFIYLIKIDPSIVYVYEQRALIYAIVGVISLALVFFFYFAAVQVAYQYGSLVRRAIDLFRLDVFPHLRMKLPTNSDEEVDQWKKISEFMQAGKDEGLFEPLLFEFESINEDELNKLSEQTRTGH